MLAWGRGDERAFDELVHRHGGPIKGYALRMLRSPEQAEEIYVETFLRVAGQRGRWENRGSVRGWLFTIAHRLCIDVIRKRKTEREAMPHVLEMENARATPSPEAIAQLGEKAARLERALAKLPEEHRQVVLLRGIHGLPASEVAVIVGMTESQVHSALSYARGRLTELIAMDERTRAVGRPA